MHPKSWIFLLSPCLALFLLVGVAASASGTPAAQASRMMVRGEVVAVNVKDTPNVIVLRSTNSKNEELIVGATVDPAVRIIRGSSRVNLSDIQVGESVDLVYVKTLDGLVARSIHVR